MGFQTMSDLHPSLSVRAVVSALRMKDHLEARQTIFEIDPTPENETALIQAQIAYDMFKEKWN